MDNGSITNEGLQQLYQQKILTPTGIYYSPQEVEEDIQAGKQVNQDQMTVLNNYWQAAGSQKIQQQPAQQAVESSPLQTQENVGFFTKLKNKFSSWFAKKSAQGNAVQEQTPQKFTVKQKEADQVRDRIAGRHNPYANHVSYEMTQQINKYWSLKDNTFNEVKRQEIDVNKNSLTYTRIFSTYVQGYQTNANGEPATEEDKKRRDEDIKWIKNYLSTDEEKHNSAIDKVVDDLLELKLTPAMLKNSYIDSHAAEILDINNKCLLISDIRTENEDYFKRMDPIKAELIQARVSNFGLLFSKTNTVLQRFAERGLNQNGQYIDGDKKMLDTIINSYRKSLAPSTRVRERMECFNQRKQTEKIVADLEQSRKEEAKKIRESTEQRSFDSVMDEMRPTMEGHLQEFSNNYDVINRCDHLLDREISLYNESEIRAASYSAVQVKMLELRDRKGLSPKEEKMEKLAGDKAIFERVQMELHRRKMATCEYGIDALLTGEKPSEEFWELLTREYGEDSVRTWRNRLA